MAKAVAKLASKSKPAPQLPAALMVELERRRAGLARHMARAVVAVVHWDDSTGVPPQRDAIAKACEAGLDLFLATAREARPATPEELRRVAQLGILQARSSQSVEPVLAAYRIAAGRVGRHPSRVARPSRGNTGSDHGHGQLRVRRAGPGGGGGHQDLLARTRAAHA